MRLPGSDAIAVLQTSHVNVTGFTVTGAGFDGILVGASSHVSVSHVAAVRNGTFVNLKEGASGVGIGQLDLVLGHEQPGHRQRGRRTRDRRRHRAATHDTVAWNHETGSCDGCGVIVAGHSTARRG